MNSNIRTKFSLALLLSICGPHLLQADTYQSFTEPDESVRVAAPEFGTIQEVNQKQGQRVRKGDLLVTLDQRVLEAALKVAKAKSEATARLDAAEVEATIKQKRLDKLKLLKDEGAGSSEEVDRATADLRIAESQVAAVREEIGLNKLEQARIAAQMDRSRVRSPIDGFVTKIDKKVGEYVSQNEPDIATVVNIDRLRARFHVATSLASQLQKGSHIVLSIPPLSGHGQDRLIKTEVDFVSPITDPDSGTVHIEVVFPNPKHSTRSGVRCRLLPNQRLDSIARETPHGRKLR